MFKRVKNRFALPRTSAADRDVNGGLLAVKSSLLYNVEEITSNMTIWTIYIHLFHIFVSVFEIV